MFLIVLKMIWYNNKRCARTTMLRNIALVGHIFKHFMKFVMF